VNIVQLKPDYLKDVEIVEGLRRESADLFFYKLRKGDLYLEVDINPNLFYFNPYEVRRKLIEGGAKLKLRYEYGLDIPLLDMDADHGNGD